MTTATATTRYRPFDTQTSISRQDLHRTPDPTPQPKPPVGLPTADTYEGPRSTPQPITSPAEIRSYVEQRQSQLPPTTDSLKKIVGELEDRGAAVTMATHAGNTLVSDDAIVLPNGECIDTIVSVGGPDAHWGYNSDGAYDPSRKVATADGTMTKFSDYLNQKGLEVPPYTPPAQTAAPGDASGAFSGAITAFLNFFKSIGIDLSAWFGGASASGGAAPASPSQGGSSGLPKPNDPSTWNDNNAPYGVTLAGFSPQDHTNLTAADLADPKNAKYAVYNYLIENQVPANKTWAPGAADALNQRYHTNLFRATDGETLEYGDEFVHTAPNGHGMAPGTYNPNANGELFWGSRSG